MLTEQLDVLASHRFNLAESLPLEIRLIRLAAGQHVLAGVVHHIAFDGWVVGRVPAELAALYTAFIENGRPTHPLTLQYADVALWRATGSRAKSWTSRSRIGGTDWQGLPRRGIAHGLAAFCGAKSPGSKTNG